MPRQQTRSSGEGAIDPSLVQKKRARHRLVGALCVCLIAAVVVPLVLESEPRPHRDVPMELASATRGSQAASGAAGGVADAGRSGAKPADAAPANAAPADAATTGKGATASGSIGTSGNSSSAMPSEAAAQAAPSQSAVRTLTPPVLAERVVPGSRAEVKPDAKPPAAVAPKVEAKPPKSEPKAAAKAEPKGDARSDPPTESPPAPARAGEPDVLAKLIDRANHPGSPKAAAGKTNGANHSADDSGNDSAVRTSRKFLVQIGAFSNVQSARNVSDRAVQVGLRPYQETVKTAQGDWIRVRVGPFTTRQDAERAQQDLKRAGVTAAIIAL